MTLLSFTVLQGSWLSSTALHGGQFRTRMQGKIAELSRRRRRKTSKMVAYEVVRDKPMYNVKFIHWCISKTEMTNELVFIVSWGIFYLYALWDNDTRALLNLYLLNFLASVSL